MFEALFEVQKRVGIKQGDCHPELNRADEFRQLGFFKGSVSLEEAVFLYGLVFITRPDEVIELGTSRGASALFLAAACKDLNKGFVTTVDLGPEPYSEALKIKNDLALPLEFKTNTNSLDFLFERSPGKQYLVFSDTEIGIRPEEVRLVFKNFPKGTVVVVHDTSDEHPGGPMRLQELFQSVELPSPRGVRVLRT